MHAAHLVPLANKLLVKPVQRVDGMLQLPVEVVVLSLDLPKQAVRQRGVSCSMAVNVAHRHTLASASPALDPAQHSMLATSTMQPSCLLTFRLLLSSSKRRCWCEVSWLFNSVRSRCRNTCWERADSQLQDDSSNATPRTAAAAPATLASRARLALSTEVSQHQWATNLKLQRLRFLTTMS